MPSQAAACDNTILMILLFEKILKNFVPTKFIYSSFPEIMKFYYPAGRSLKKHESHRKFHRSVWYHASHEKTIMQRFSNFYNLSTTYIYGKKHKYHKKIYSSFMYIY